MTIKQALKKLKKSGIKFHLRDEKLLGYSDKAEERLPVISIRANIFKTPHGVPCCPLNALYQKETQRVSHNTASTAWRQHFGIDEKDIALLMNCADFDFLSDMFQQEGEKAEQLRTIRKALAELCKED